MELYFPSFHTVSVASSRILTSSFTYKKVQTSSHLPSYSLVLVWRLGFEGAHKGVKVILSSLTSLLALAGLLDGLGLGKPPLQVGKFLRCFPVLLYLWRGSNLISIIRYCY